MINFKCKVSNAASLPPSLIRIHFLSTGVTVLWFPSCTDVHVKRGGTVCIL